MTKIKFNYPLLEHQERAYNKLKKYRVGALYMSMGTGKTRTMLEIIKDKFDRDKINSVIWFCPCSAKKNIEKEFEKHIKEGVGKFLICGTESISSSVKLYSYLLNYVQENKCMIVVDESTHIKNYKAKRSQRIIKLGEKVRYRYILSGTPTPRDELDLFSQWYFLDWRILGYRSMWAFEKNHAVYHKTYTNRIVGIKNVEQIATKIAPYTYQVSLEECVSLPEKVYSTRYFSLTEGQQCMYDDFARYFIETIDEWKPETIYRMFNVLQGICAGYVYSIHGHRIDKVAYLDSIKTNPRLEYFMSIIDSFKDKTIIFCEYSDEMNTITDLLNARYGKNAAVKFYGELSLKERNKNIDMFSKSSRFLVANKQCAGFSLNLQFCNNIIFYSNDWDYGTRGQAEDRIYRIGQTKKTYYLDLVCANTVEELIVTCLAKKESLSRSFLKAVEKCKDKKETELFVYKQLYSRDNSKERLKIVEDLNENIQ